MKPEREEEGGGEGDDGSGTEAKVSTGEEASKRTFWPGYRASERSRPVSLRQVVKAQSLKSPPGLSLLIASSFQIDSLEQTIPSAG